MNKGKLLIGIFLLMYFIDQYNLVGKGEIVLWVLLILLIRFKFPKVHLNFKPKFAGSVRLWSFNTGVAFIVLYLVGGMLVGFGNSPYDQSLQGMIKNILTVGIVLIAREYVRNYSVHTLVKRNNNWIIPGIILMMTLTSLSIGSLKRIQDLQTLTIFAAEIFLPELSENILATYLVLYGGVPASLIYLGMVEAFEWLSPILPHFNWLVKAMIGMAVPLIGVSIITQSYMQLTKQVKRSRAKEESIWKLIPIAAISVLMIWFTVGVFPIYPAAIATGSMQPMIDPGDVVLVKKIESMEALEALQVGDVIQFKKDNIFINHRIIAIEEKDGNYQYQTKGDNNSTVDKDWVQAEDIKGKIVEVIPKIGWPTLLLKNSNKEPPIEVEF